MSKVRKVLLIDDEKDFTFFLSKNLEATDRFTVEVANDAQIGIEKAKTVKPDIIILDIYMPNTDGIAVLKEIKVDPKTLFIPVIMLTAAADDIYKWKAENRLCEDYLAKPVQLTTVVDAIDAIFKKRRWPFAKYMMLLKHLLKSSQRKKPVK